MLSLHVMPLKCDGVRRCCGPRCVSCNGTAVRRPVINVTSIHRRQQKNKRRRTCPFLVSLESTDLDDHAAEEADMRHFTDAHITLHIQIDNRQMRTRDKQTDSDRNFPGATPAVGRLCGIRRKASRPLKRGAKTGRRLRIMTIILPREYLRLAAW